MDLAYLLRPDGLLAVNIGSLPAASVKRMGEALSMTGYVIYNFDTIGDQVYAVIAGPRDRHDEVRGLLSQAGWRELPVPPELRTHPRTARAWLSEERQRFEHGMSPNAPCWKACAASTARASTKLACASSSVARWPRRPCSASAARGAWPVCPDGFPGAVRTNCGKRWKHGFMATTGWISRRRPAEAAMTPSLVRYPAWLKPFVPLVRSYGVPRYGEFDPALPFALPTCCCSAPCSATSATAPSSPLLAIAFRQAPRPGGLAGHRGRRVSMLFGFFYGSIFGFEDIIEPLWMSPLHDPIRMLTIAMAFGVGFIVFTLLVNACNRLAAGHVAEALFDSTGLAGLVFYLGAVGGWPAWRARHAALPSWPLALPASSRWRLQMVGSQGRTGRADLVTAIETLETGINLFANTLSFMRVAAFSLNHVALALAVFTLANGLGAAGHWLTIVLGNIVIIVLEGGIVAIQALRLMYYEGFSRFFSGDGTNSFR